MVHQTELRANAAPGTKTEVFITSVDKAALLSPDQILVSFESNDKEGLSGNEVKKRLETFGKNEFERKGGISPFRLFLNQFWSTVIALLLIAAGVSYLNGELLQAAAILSAVLINAIVGFITEYQAQISLSTLEKLAGPIARVRRDNRDLEISASELVPGDLLIIDSGCRIPADVRFISSASLSVDESMLTGESASVFKDTHTQLDALSTGVGYQGSLVLSGRAKAIVIATGKSTKLGQLGEDLSKIHSKATPLESDLEKLGQKLSLLTIFICAFVFAIGILHGEDSSVMIQTSIALAIAAIPEGLPVVATMALASGTAKMVNLGVLIRKLSAVETLGCTQVICTDKTGTLTQNKMSVTDIVFIDSHISVSGTGYEPLGDFFEHDSQIEVDKHPQLHTLMTIAALCNDAKLEKHNDQSEWHIHGDPTEGALLTAAHKGGVEQNEQKKLFPRIHEYPFDLNRKRMSTVHSREKTDSMVFVKGAPESVLSICNTYLTDSGPELLDAEKKNWVMQKNNELANKGLRVLALASKSIKNDLITNITVVENELTLVGLVGMADQAKQGVREAIEQCQNAGIRVIMLTGDQPSTAKSIAEELHIISSYNAGEVVNISEIDTSKNDSLSGVLSRTSVLARVQPEMKLAIVRSLQSMGYVVAMTGDGINDATSLRQADIGVSMGLNGTSVAREASDMVLTDDNFASIVHAIEQGRNIYANITCAIAYLLTASLASVFTVMAAVCFDTGLPLSPLQLLWLNLIMHIFPALGLVMQKSNPSLMKDKPRGRNQNLLNKREFIEIILRSAIVAAATITVANLYQSSSSEKVKTIVLACLSLSLLLQSWSWYCRSRMENGFDISLLKNTPMILSSSLGLVLLLVSIIPNPLQQLLSTVSLNALDWGTICLFSTVSFAGTLPFAIKNISKTPAAIEESS